MTIIKMCSAAHTSGTKDTIGNYSINLFCFLDAFPFKKKFLFAKCTGNLAAFFPLKVKFYSELSLSMITTMLEIKVKMKKTISRQDYSVHFDANTTQCLSDTYL